jgi:signal transduction histidine kinase
MHEHLGASLVDSKGKVLGVMLVLLVDKTQSFRPEDVETLSIIAAQVSMSIERLKAQENLAEVNRKLAEAFQAKSSFISNMSHELRTPLNAIIGFTEVLQDQLFGPLNKKQENYMTNIQSSGRHLLSLINDILDISKVESGKMTLDLDKLNISILCRDIMTMLMKKANNQQVSLHCDVCSSMDDVPVIADRRKLKQILYNLVDNGIKFNRPGGSVSIGVRKASDNPNSAAMQIVVEDTGMGIAAADQEKLFQPFSRLGAKSSDEKQIEGTGLGLALTKQLVELHGGRIHLESEPGKGSRFVVSIPIQQEA